MIVLVALTAGLVFWICGWAFGLKSFDAFLVAVLLVVAASTVRIAAPFIRQTRGSE